MLESVRTNIESFWPGLKPHEPNDHSIVGCNMLRAFGHPVAMYCDMLSVFWLKFENGQIFHSTFVHVA